MGFFAAIGVVVVVVLTLFGAVTVAVLISEGLE